MFNQEVTIEEIKQETPDVKTFKFLIKLDFEPGQYIMLETIKGTRQFSISSSPTKDYIELTIKKYQDSEVASYLHTLQPKDKVTIKGPLGRFTLNEQENNLIFLAAGNGITPIRSMINYITDKNLDKNMTLIYSNKTEQDIIFYKELKSLKNLKTIFTLTKQDWPVKGRINKELIKENLKENSSFYIVGSNSFIDSMVEILKELNVKTIHREVFVRSQIKTN